MLNRLPPAWPLATGTAVLFGLSSLLGAPTPAADGQPRLVMPIGQFAIADATEGQEEQRGLFSLEFSPEGDRLASSSMDGTARIWDTTGRELAVLAHPHWVWQTRFSPDSSRILTVSSDGAARLWDRQGNLQFILHGSGFAWQASAHFLPDGEAMLTSHFGAATLLWTRSGHCRASFGQEIFENTLTALPDGSRLSRCETSHSTPLPAIRSLAVSPDGQFILTAERDTVQLWNRQGQVAVAWQTEATQVNEAVFSPDGQRILTAATDATARLWDRDGQPVAVLTTHARSVETARFGSSGDRLFTLDSDGRLQLWDRQGKPLVAAADLEARRFVAAAWSPAGGCLATVSADNQVQFRDHDGKQLAEISGSPIFAFSPASNHFAALAVETGRVQIWQFSDCT